MRCKSTVLLSNQPSDCSTIKHSPEKLLMAYSVEKGEIQMIHKSGKVTDLSEVTENVLDFKPLTKYFVCYPK